MCSEYYFEVQRKSYELKQNFNRPFDDSSENPNLNIDFCENTGAENLLTDYEVVSNEEFGGEEEAAQEAISSSKFKNVDLSEGLQFPLNYNGKLYLNLNAEKIALKSQPTKINKSIEQETEANIFGKNIINIRQRTEDTTSSATILCRRHKEQQQQPLHMPIAFTIIPKNVTQRYENSDNVGKFLPEIILTSHNSENIKANEIPTNATCNVIGTRVKERIVQPISRALPPPPQSSEAATTNKFPSYEKIAYLPPKLIEASRAEVYDKLHETEDNSDNSNSRQGSSTSPESLMDNILSAASSVSVRSSSLSSGGTEIVKYGDSSCGGSRGIAKNTKNTVVVVATTHIDDVGCKESKSHVAFKTTTKETPDNRTLNLKSSELKLLPTTQAPSPMFSPLSPTKTIAIATAPTTTTTRLNKSQTLHLPNELIEANSNRSRSPSPSHSITIRITPDASLYPEELKCPICAEVFRDPRTLNCLHSFCFQCIVEENFKQDSSIPFWSQPGTDTNDESDWKTSNKSNYSIRSSSPDMSMRSGSTSPLRQRRASFSFKRKKSLDKILLKARSEGKSSDSSSSVRLNNYSEDKLRMIVCKVCNYTTGLPLGGIRQLPQNFLLVRKVEEIKLKVGDEVISRVWCTLCIDETSALYHCISCTLNLCTLCKESHERQRNTANHNINNIMDLRRARKQKQNMLGDNAKFTLKCGMHAGFEMKSFCSTCLQIACADCLVLLHKGHKHEPITKAATSFSKILRESAEQTRPLCNYAEHSIGRLNEIAKRINNKCDDVQAEVEIFMSQYFEAVDVHRKTLLQQIHRARESKVEMILEQQMDLEKRNNEAMDAVRFSQELSDVASDVEILSFVNILLKRFEYCQQFKTPVDPKISDSLHFLPEIRAPTNKAQNNIPLFGIITMQTVEPSLCTLQWEGFSQLRLHKKIELLMLSRDADGASLCHGGLQINALVKYKEYNSKFLPVEISDHRDGTYGISFTPDSQGTLLLTVTTNDKPIKGNPFTFLARTVRPHSGAYHCCTFCSSKGSRLVKCSCAGRMPGYNGCGHGHPGHPGSRHWSCCGNILENSECNVANKLLNP